MSQRRTTVPPTRNHSRSPASGRKGLIASTKTKKQSARRELPLTIAFIEHISRSAASGHREPSAERHGHCRRFSNNAICSGRDAAQVSLDQALQRRASERPLVGCYAELGVASRDSYLEFKFNWEVAALPPTHNSHDSGRPARGFELVIELAAR